MRAFFAHGEPDKILLKLHELIQEAYDATSGNAKQLQFRATLQLNSEEDEVLADKVQIEQVLINLIRNAQEAIDASERREIVISTSFTGIDIRVDIVDTGVGLSEKVKSSLFEPFMTTKANGMGAGRIWAESNPEGGAAFSFTLPLASRRTELEDERPSSADFSQC